MRHRSFGGGGGGGAGVTAILAQAGLQLPM